MPALGPAELQTWRTHPYSYRGYLYIYQPEIVFQARINRPQGFGSGAMYHQIDYNNVTTGSHTDVRTGMTIWLGTTPGGRDRGQSYIQRPPTSSLIYTGLSPRGQRRGELDPAHQLHITVLRLWEVWAKTPYIPPPNSDNTYRDTLDYGPQLAMPPVAVAGSDAIGWVDATTNTLTLNFDGTNSYAVAEGAAIAAYAWNFGAGATPSSAATSVVTGVQFTPGAHWISLTVTDNQNPAQSHTTWRLVVALNGTTVRPVEGIDQLTIRSRAEGQVLECDLYEPLSSTQYPPGTRVLYGEDEWYGGQRINLVGAPGRRNLRFSGWLDEEPVGVEAAREGNLAATRLTARDAAGCLDRLNGYPMSVRRNNSSTRWEEMRHATVDRLAHHIGHWLSTVTYCADFRLSGTANTRPFAHMDATGGSLYEQLDNVARAIGHRMTCDQRGRMQMRPDPMIAGVNNRTSVEIVTLQEQDWSSFDYTLNEKPKVGVMRASALLTSTMNADSVPVEELRVLSIAPSPRAHGQAAGSGQESGWLVTSQAEANERLGHYYARANSIYSLFEVELAHTGDAGIDPALMEWVRLQLGTHVVGQRQQVFGLQRWLPVEIMFNHAAGAGGWSKTVRLTCELETVGTPGFADDGMITTLPRYVPPTITSPARPIGRGDRLNAGTGTIALFLGNGRLARTGPAINGSGFSASYPNWDIFDLTTLTNWSGTTLIDFQVDAFSPLYLGTGNTVNGWIMTNTHVQRITDIFGTPALTPAHALTFNTVAGCMHFERGVQNWGICAQHRNSPGGGTAVAYTTDGLTWTNVTINANYEQNYTTNGNIWVPGLAVSPHIPGRAYTSAMLGANTPGGSGFQGYVTTNYGATWSLLPTSTCNITDDVFNAQTIVVPYTNTTMTIAYYGGHIGTNNAKPEVFRAIGSNKTDISPVVAGEKYGIDHRFGMRQGNRQLGCAEDGNTIVLCGTTRPVSARKFAVFVSRNQGATWTQITPITTAAANSFSGVYVTNVDTYYLIGPDGNVALVTDGQTVVNKRGDLSTTAQVVGLCGG